jgi:hypothetical protein
MYKITVFSRHPSHKILRKALPHLPIRSLIRLGSVTEFKDNINRVEINSVESIKLSANKRLMKEQFNQAGCATARWTNASDVNSLMATIKKESLRFPIVAKHIYGSRGTGNTLLHEKDELINWARNRDFNKYIFENYMSFLLEYRLHVTKNGCFYACRKALIKDTRSSERWRRHKDNSVWLLEANPDFHKPNSWDDIVNTCVAALKQIGADILSFDVRVQSKLDKDGKPRKRQEFILIECNSASSMQSPQNKEISVCASKYLEVIPKLIMEKAGK